MNVWRSWHIYYADLDQLLLKCVEGAMLQGSGLDQVFWIRHYAGGPHLRIRARGNEQILECFREHLCQDVGKFMKDYPSSADSGYSAERAAALLELEGESTEGEDFSHHIDEIVERNYDRLHHGLPSSEALALLENFYQATGDMAISILRSDRGILAEALRFYYLTLIAATGSLERGAVSAKSHWCGFAAFRLPPDIVEAIKVRYNEQRPLILAQLKDVLKDTTSPSTLRDPLLVEWEQVLSSFRGNAHDTLLEGHDLCFHLTRNQVVQQRSKISDSDFARFPFLRTLWQDVDYLEAMRSDIHLAVPRVLTNLYYALIGPQLGLRAIDKIALCYFVYMSVEEWYGCNLDDRLRMNVAAARQRRNMARASTLSRADEMGGL